MQPIEDFFLWGMSVVSVIIGGVRRPDEGDDPCRVRSRAPNELELQAGSTEGNNHKARRMYPFPSNGLGTGRGLSPPNLRPVFWGQNVLQTVTFWIWKL